MPTLIEKPHVIQTAGTIPMMIEEYIGRYSSDSQSVSIAKITSPGERVESGKIADYHEYIIVLSGILKIESRKGIIEAGANQAVIVERKKWVRITAVEDTEYISICLPAFAPRMIVWDNEHDSVPDIPEEMKPVNF